ncbi:DUF2752 domain-containing protein [Mariniphaga sp.]|uniref:DUF2752 domain-containing protein n=1 Tax=Mariniphaga sp. TaxID=1954475 RepID=UPI00356415CF
MKKIIYGGLLIALAALAVLFFVLDPAEHVFFPRCIFHSLSGWYCPGCGSQRAIHSLLHLNITGVVQNNILFLPAVLVIFYHYTHPILNKKLNWRLPNILYLKNTPWVIFGIILLFWVLRNLTVYPFSVLAPG